MVILLFCLCTAFIHLSNKLEMKVEYKAGKRGCFTRRFWFIWRWTITIAAPSPLRIYTCPPVGLRKAVQFHRCYRWRWGSCLSANAQVHIEKCCLRGQSTLSFLNRLLLALIFGTTWLPLISLRRVYGFLNYYYCYYWKRWYGLRE